MGLIKTNIDKKNLIINGGFDFMQRFVPSTGVANPGVSSYTFDRWHMWDGATNATITRQSAGAPLGSTNFARITHTGSGYLNISQALESSFVNCLKGKTITFSVSVRRNSTLPDGSNFIEVEKNTTADTVSGGSWSSLGTKTLTGVPISTSSPSDWARYSLTVAIPNDGTANGLRFNLRYNAAQPNGAILEWSQVMLNEGPVAAPFQTAGANIEEELAMCQRYYEKSYDIVTAPQTATKTGAVIINTVSSILNTARYGSVRLKVIKRTTPTITIYPVVATISSGVVTDLEGANLAANSGSTINIGDSAFDMKNTSGGTLTLTSAYSGVNFHYIADAEL